VKFQSRPIHLGLSQWKMKEHLCCKKSGSHGLHSKQLSSPPLPNIFILSGPLDISLRATISIKFVVVLMCRTSSAGCTLQTCITINSILHGIIACLEKKILVLICIELVWFHCFAISIHNLRQVKWTTKLFDQQTQKIFCFRQIDTLISHYQ